MQRGKRETTNRYVTKNSYFEARPSLSAAEGGELKERWQNSLAEVTLRLMEANAKQKAENEKRYEQEYNEQHNQQA